MNDPHGHSELEERSMKRLDRLLFVVLTLVAALFFLLCGAGAWPAFAQGSLLADVQAARTHYPSSNLSPAQLAALLNEVAWAHQAEGWGLLLKPNGNNCPSPAGPAVACDILFNAPAGLAFDVLTDAEGAARPQWGGGEALDRSRFLAPTQPAGGPTPPPTPIPTPPPPPIDVAGLQRSLDAILAQQTATAQRLEAITVQLEALSRRPIPYPIYTARLFGQTVTLTPKQP